MKTLKDYIKEWLNADTVVTSTQTESIQENLQDNSAEVEGKNNSSEFLQIYTTTKDNLKYWHAFGSLCELQKLLQEYDFNFGNSAYDQFKIGYSVEGHFASFAIDDTHYYKIQFTEYDGEPIDRKSAAAVFEKIKSLRTARR